MMGIKPDRGEFLLKVDYVSILGLMDDGYKEIDSFEKKLVLVRFNPWFNG